MCLPPGLSFVSKTITKTLFQNVGSATLCLLSGIFVSSDVAASVQIGALKHAQAFIASRCDGTAFKQDFQIILPALLQCLMSEATATREAACECIAVLATGDQSAKDVPIYSYDVLYGESFGMPTFHSKKL